MTNLYVNNIIDFSFVDGPGNRLSIFLQGCNFNCGYCHNPETISSCQHCGHCATNCPKGAISYTGGKTSFDYEKCTNCDLCITNCPHKTTPKVTEFKVEELYEYIFKRKDFIAGVTVSGGECTLQWEGLTKLFSKIKTQTKLTTFIDSNANISDTVLEKLFAVTDKFMLDIKAVDNIKHKEITGVSNSQVLKAIKKVYFADKLYELRHVVVPGINDTEEDLQLLANFIKDIDSNLRFVLIPFRNLGVKAKYKELPSLDTNSLKEVEVFLANEGLTNVVTKE